MDTANIMLKPEYLKIVRYNPNNQKTGNAKARDISTAVKAPP